MNNRWLIVALYCLLSEIVSSLQDESTTSLACRPISRIPKNVIANCNLPHGGKLHHAGSYCKFSCKKGFILIGNSRSDCIYDEELKVSYYVHPSPKCKLSSKLKCPMMRPAKSGSVLCSNRNKLGSKCVHKCPDGQQMVQGNVTSTCLVADGVVQWSSKPGKCIKDDDITEESEDYEEEVVEQRDVEKSPKLEKLYDEERYFIQRDARGAGCPPINISPSTTTISCTDGRKLGSKCSFQCTSGYGILGSRFISCIKSKSGPRWTGQVPRCQLKTCPALPSRVNNGKVICSRGNLVKSQCMYRCNDGFHVNGIAQVTCYSGRGDSYLGVWSNNEIPRCTRCKADQFHCSADNRCIDVMKLCDGTFDCPDGEDEKKCLDGERIACGNLHNGNSGFLRSPTLTNGLYSHCTYCNWTIEVPKGYRVKMHFLAFDIEYSGPECEFDGVAIGDIDGGQEAVDAFDWSEKTLVKNRYCGRRQFFTPVMSDTNRVGIVFYSNNNAEGRGFSMLWSKVRAKT